jgi:geranylgeranyl diphosphate synthase type II
MTDALSDRIEALLEESLSCAVALGSPPTLREALRHAVFPAGGRIRPRLCLEVARACGEPGSTLAEAAATAIELVHCASLVHDDLPCFDDASTRRGQPSVHVAFGEPTAVLAGDALIVLAFETVARRGEHDPVGVVQVVRTLARCVGAAQGIIAGQAWEAEARVPLAAYHRAKTASLFEAAVVSGAIAAGHDGAAWRALGDRLGMAYQVADDLADAIGRSSELGKPVGRDDELGRPSAARELGVDGASRRLYRLLDDARDAVPACPGRADLLAWLRDALDALLVARGVLRVQRAAVA